MVSIPLSKAASSIVPPKQAITPSQPSALPYEKWFPILTPTENLNEWIRGNASQRHFSYTDGTLAVQSGTMVYPLVVIDASIRAKARQTQGHHIGLSLRVSDQGSYYSWFAGRSFGIGKIVDKKAVALADGKLPHARDDFFASRFSELKFSGSGDALTISIDGKQMLQAHDTSHAQGAVAVGAFQGGGLFTEVEMLIPDKKSIVTDNRNPAAAAKDAKEKSP